MMSMMRMMEIASSIRRGGHHRRSLVGARQIGREHDELGV